MNNECAKNQASLHGISRLKAFLAAAVCLTLLVAAKRLHPEPSGIGTHTQLHLPACGFYERTGYPCPTCGVTTAFSLGAQGHLFQALKTQPLGAALALLCWLTLLLGISGMIHPVFLEHLHQKCVTIHLRLDCRFSSVNGIWWFYGLSAAGLILISWLVVCLRVRVSLGWNG